MTIIQLCEANAINYESAYKTLSQRGGIRFTKHTEVTPDLESALLEYKAGTRQKTGGQPSEKTEAAPEPISQVNRRPRQPRQTQPQTVAPVATTDDRTILTLTLLVNVMSVGLTCYGLVYFAKWPGGILGAMFSLYLLSTVLVCRQKMKGDTSQAALNTLAWMEAGAGLLHSFTFYAVIESTDQFVKVSAATGLAASASFLSYKAAAFVRLYYAETPEQTKATEQNVAV